MEVRIGTVFALVAGVGAGIAVAGYSRRSQRNDTTAIAALKHPPQPEEINRKLESAFELEVTDPAWAVTMATAIDHGLATLPVDAGVQIEAAQCRRTTCRVRLRWSSMDVARRQYHRLVQSYLGVNCAQAMFLAPQTSTVYTADLMLVCPRS